MKHLVFVIAPKDFNDYELQYPRSLLEENGFEVTIVSTMTGTCNGMHGSKVESRMTIEEVDPDDYNGIIVVGGNGALAYLQKNQALIRLFRRFNDQDKLVSAIGRGRHVLHNAGLFGTNFSWGTKVEIHGNVIAARPPATTPGWTSKGYGQLLVKHLTSKYLEEKRDYNR